MEKRKDGQTDRRTDRWTHGQSGFKRCEDASKKEKKTENKEKKKEKKKTEKKKINEFQSKQRCVEFGGGRGAEGGGGVVVGSIDVPHEALG